jgi:DNA-binding response OmpR family regulator
MAESKTILIIEDDADVLSIMVKHLMKVGYEVITAVDGMEGLKKLETETYDLVITDIVMPYVSGVGVVSAIKPVRMSLLKDHIETLLSRSKGEKNS